MKKFHLLYLVLAFICITCEKKGNFTNESLEESLASKGKNLLNIKSLSGLYYWSGGKKNTLEIDSSIVIIESTSDSTSFINAIKSGLNKDVNAVRLKKQNLFLLRSDQIVASIGNISAKGLSVSAIHASYKFGKSLEMIPTGEIVLKLKLGGSIQDLLGKYSGKAELVKTKKRNKFTIRANNISDVLDIANQIYESGKVEWCHPSFIVPIVRNSNDTYYSQQYYLNQTNNFDINAPEAWDLLGTLNCPIRVAVIDDGVENHSELTGRVLSGFTPLNSSGLGAPTSSSAHGEAVSGIIAAKKDNNSIIAGIAPNANIIPVNIFYGFESDQDIADGIEWAWDEGDADILSNSWGYGVTSISNPGYDDITDAITEARTLGRDGKGSIVIFSSGNSNSTINGVSFPANVNGVITVGAVDRNGSIWNYSQRGPEMDLVAPSGNVNLNGDFYTIDRTGSSGYSSGDYMTNFGGTSAACPQVAGVAVLMLTANPSLTEAQLRSILQSTATDMGDLGFDNTYGYGRLNAEAAVRAALPSITGEPNYCSTTSFAINNLPTGATILWSVGSPATITGVNNGNTVTISGGNSSGRTLNAQITTPCGTLNIQKSIYMGVRTPSNLTAETGSSWGVSRVHLSFLAVPTAVTYKWYVNGEYRGQTTAPSITLLIEDCGVENTVEVEAINSCGTSSRASVQVIPWCG
ncbi:Serine protease, subtilisin family [bacterium A37T11]|nr:Serine protease, subtilisin family [bacterium A37T11]